LKLSIITPRVGAAGALATALCVGAFAGAAAASSVHARASVKPKFTTHPLADDSNPGGVVKGPDGNLWSTELYTGVIDRVTAAGQITPFHLKGIKGFPNYITVGPDHALWFTVEPNTEDDTGQGIGRITTEGKYNFWPIHEIFGSPVSPQDIVAGPGNTLWFTFNTKSQEGGIGRIHLSDPGRVTAFRTGPKTGPLTIAPGPDETFWFTEETANKIGRITSAGKIKTYHAPGGPFGLTPAPGGGAWFTEYHGNRVAKITHDGIVSECPVLGPADTLPTFIVHKNGYFWLFESGDPEGHPPVAARLTAVDANCHATSWPLPAGRQADPWYLGDGFGDTLAFTQFSPASVGTITLEGTAGRG
jgi:virginiamycin B lyase